VLPPGSEAPPGKESIMNRMLIVLVVLLTASMGGLWVYVLDLQAQVDANPGRAQRAESTHAAAPDTAAREEIESLEARIRNLENAKRIASARDSIKPASTMTRTDDNPSSAPADLGLVQRPTGEIDRDGNYAFTDGEVEYAMALNREVSRRQRVASMTRSYMRRIDRMIANNEISQLPDESRAKVEQAISSYVEKSQEYFTTVFRNPSPEILALDRDQRREMISTESERLKQETTIELQTLLSQTDAEAIAGTLTLRNLRGDNRRSLGGQNNNRRRNRNSGKDGG